MSRETYELERALAQSESSLPVMLVLFPAGKFRPEE